MKKILLPKAGKPSNFQIVERPDLKITKDNQVLVDVHFSGINFADIMMRLGLYPDAPAFPFTPGYEISGKVKAIGSNIQDLKVGDPIIGGCYFDGYSSEVLLEDWQVVKLPESLDLKEGASLLVSYLTAYMVFFELGRVRDGDKILIDCASGALGQLSIQMLKNLKVEIIGLTSSQLKKEFLSSLGIKAMTHQEFYNSKENGFHLALNSLGGKSIDDHYQRLSPGGRIVCIGAASFVENGKRNLLKAIKGLIQMPRKSAVTLMNDNKGIMGLNALRLFDHPEILKAILKKMKDFDLSPNVDSVFSYHEIAKAHEFLEQKKAKGKVLIGWTDVL